jgi:hypothetical protein
MARKLGYSAWAGASPVVSIGETVKVGGVSIVQDVPDVEIDYPTYDEQITDLASGDNTIALPYGKVTQLIVAPPEDTTETITLKGAAGDVGLEQAAGGIVRLSFPTTSPPSSIILNASGTIKAIRLVWA